jgi:hypothetical protein
MSKIIAFTNELGGVSICVPTGELSIQEVKAKDTPLNSVIMDASELPEADNDFFNAWELIDGYVLVNLDKAKLQTKDRLRVERAPLLAAQDVAFQRALEESKNTATIVAEKQRLRDITNLVDGCKTTEELRGLKCQ